MTPPYPPLKGRKKIDAQGLRKKTDAQGLRKKTDAQRFGENPLL
jgi:hypothetical protein